MNPLVEFKKSIRSVVKAFNTFHYTDSKPVDAYEDLKVAIEDLEYVYHRHKKDECDQTDETRVLMKENKKLAELVGEYAHELVEMYERQRIFSSVEVPMCPYCGDMPVGDYDIPANKIITVTCDWCKGTYDIVKRENYQTRMHVKVGGLNEKAHKSFEEGAFQEGD